ISRSLARCTLTEGCERFRRSAARVTLCSVSSTSSVTSKFRSRRLRLFMRIPGILVIHFQYGWVKPHPELVTPRRFPMNVLIVYAHPEPRSLNGALKDFTVQRLQAAGHAVQVSDLYAMRSEERRVGTDARYRQT